LKWWKVLLLCLASLLLALVLLVWFAPARWLAPSVNARLRGASLQGVGGSLWDGHADQVRAPDGTVLGRLRWTLSRRALLGRPQGHVALDGPWLQASGDFSRDAGVTQWHDVHLRVALDDLPAPLATPWGRPRGMLVAAVADARLRGGWPESLRAELHWDPAVMRTPSGDLALGHLALAPLTASQGVLQAALHDDGHGPLRLDGRLQASPLGWRLEADLAARRDDPALRRWLARFGTLDAQGVVHLHRGAGLGALPSSTGEHR
jgi:general secretion pathway protein N